MNSQSCIVAKLSKMSETYQVFQKEMRHFQIRLRFSRIFFRFPPVTKKLLFFKFYLFLFLHLGPWIFNTNHLMGRYEERKRGSFEKV